MATFISKSYWIFLIYVNGKLVHLLYSMRQDILYKQSLNNVSKVSNIVFLTYLKHFVFAMYFIYFCLITLWTAGSPLGQGQSVKSFD